MSMNNAVLSGLEAIEYARANNLAVKKYADPTEDAREDLTIYEAELVAREDARLLYIEVPVARYEVRVIGDSSFEYLVAVSDDANEAKTRATELGTAYYGGVAVIDTVTNMADMGNCVVALDAAFAERAS